MNEQQKKQLRELYKTRHPDMGVLDIACPAAGAHFLFLSRDAANGFNRHQFQLEAGMHPNKTLSALWKAHGAEGFVFQTAGLIQYDDPAEDQSEKLEALLETCLTEIPGARKL